MTEIHEEVRSRNAVTDRVMKPCRPDIALLADSDEHARPHQILFQRKGTIHCLLDQPPGILVWRWTLTKVQALKRQVYSFKNSLSRDPIM